MMYSLKQRQSYGGDPCMACAGNHDNGWNQTIDRFVKPRDCACGCHNIEPARQAEFSRIFASRDGYDVDEKTPFANRARAYVGSDGKMLDGYLKAKGREAYTLAGAGTVDLEHAVAAALISDGKAYIVGDRRFDEKVGGLARVYGLPKEWVERYVFDHENTHRWQKGKRFFSEQEAERDVEETLMGYYADLAKRDPDNKRMYEGLGRVAADRAKGVERNYARVPAHEQVGETVAA